MSPASRRLMDIGVSPRVLTAAWRAHCAQSVLHANRNGLFLEPAGVFSMLPSNTLARIVGCLSKSGSDWVVTSVTTPERIERAGVGPADASRPLGTRTMTLKFVLTRLDSFVGQRVSVSGILMGAGGSDGINVTTVSRVAESCP